MQQIQSRKEKFRQELENLKDNESIVAIVMDLYPSELDKLKSEYSSMEFNVIDTFRDYTYKKYRVRIYKKL